VTVATTKFSSGVVGTFDAGYASEGMSREIFGTEGSIRLNHYDADVELLLDRAYESEVIKYDTPGKARVFAGPKFDLESTGNPFNQQRMFVEAIRAGKPAHMGGDVGRRDLTVVMGAYESAREGKAVRV
jgi:predicted dehydrogenase